MQIKHIIFLIVLFCFSSCKRDEFNPCSNDFVCRSFDFSIASFETDGIQHKYPSVNPNNPNEFVFALQDFDTNTWEIYKYDLTTNAKTLLVEDKRMIGNAKWNNKGEIAFNDLTYQVWVINDDGTNLYQLTESTNNLFPAWDNTGDIIYYYYSPVLGIPYYLLKRNIHSNHVDTVYKAFSQFNDISQDNKLLSYSSDPGNEKPSISTSEIPEIDFDPVIFDFFNTRKFSSCQGLAWGKDNIAYATFFKEGEDFKPGGIYEIDVLTKQYHKIVTNCDNLTYEKISCTADGKWLMAERIEYEQKLNANGDLTASLIQRSKICRINLETMEETIIDIN